MHYVLNFLTAPLPCWLLLLILLLDTADFIAERLEKRREEKRRYDEETDRLIQEACR